jgi:paraquat-inducible protein A
MIEVFMVGVLVAYSKLSNVADVLPGSALWLFAILTVLLTWVNSIPFRLFWEALEPAASFAPLELGNDTRLNRNGMALTAKRAGLLPCHACGLLVKKNTIPHGRAPACPRCHSKLHQRAPYSLALTWAYLIASAVLYIPANTLSVMHTATLLGEKDDTILSGVIFLWDTGSWFLAVVVFIASIIVPLFKISALALLTATAQKRSSWQCDQRSRLYRLIELVGRWSMLDLFVVTLMAALVRQRALATIVAGPAAAAFGAVVVLTVLAAQWFDPRLTWDACENLKVDK